MIPVNSSSGNEEVPSVRDQIRIIEPWRPGAQQINSVVRDALLPWLLDHANVVHQCGPDNVEGLHRHAARLPAQCAGRYHLAAHVGG